MPRNQLSKDELKSRVLKLKNQLYKESIGYTSDPKALANKYLNEILFILEQYSR